MDSLRTYEDILRHSGYVGLVGDVGQSCDTVGLLLWDVRELEDLLMSWGHVWME